MFFMCMILCICGCPLPVGLVSWTVLHVRWSGCCDSLKDAPEERKTVSLQISSTLLEVTTVKCPTCNYC